MTDVMEFCTAMRGEPMPAAELLASLFLSPLCYARYVDVEEEETTLIAMSIKDLQLARQGEWGVSSRAAEGWML